MDPRRRDILLYLVEDAALMLEVLAGHDSMDATSSPLPTKPYRKLLKEKRENVTIGIADDYFEGVDPEIVTAVQKALHEFERLGHRVKNIKLFDPQYAIAVYTIIQRSEVSSNSFVERAINYELKRQGSILERGETPIQETRGWDEKRHITLGQRSKEEAMDYRYFPEPDIPPFRWQPGEIDELQKALPELPDEKKARFIQSYHITEYDAERLTRERRLADFFEGAVKVGQEHGLDPKTIANVVMNKKIDIDTTVPAGLIEDIVASLRIDAIDETELQSIVQEVIASDHRATDFSRYRRPAKATHDQRRPECLRARFNHDHGTGYAPRTPAHHRWRLHRAGVRTDVSSLWQPGHAHSPPATRAHERG